MPKDRLDQLLSDSNMPYRDENIVIFRDNNEKIDNFYGEVEEIQGMIDEVEEQVTRVKKKFKEIFESIRVEQISRQELEDLMEDIKSNSKEIKTKLSEMEENTNRVKQNRNAESRIRELQHSILTRRFIEVMKDYNKVQIDFRDKSKKLIQSQLEITGRKVTKEQLDDMLEQETPDIFTEGLILETQQMKQSLADITARHSDIVKLEISIREVHDMFVEMALLVADQSEKIDRVEYHVDNAVEHVKLAGFEASKAQQYASKARRKKIMLSICLVVTLSVLFIIFILWLKNIFL